MPIKVLNHPLFNTALTRLREKDTSSTDFRTFAEQAAIVLAVEATGNLETITVGIESPLAPCSGLALKNSIAIVPVLRAGLSLVPAFQRLLPTAVVGHLGLKRNEKTAKAECYLSSLPNMKGFDVMILDPMLATGGSAVSAIEAVSSQSLNSLHLVSVIAAPEGLNLIQSKFPHVHVTVGVVDERLNEQFFIVPGLGDFGDRYFGTVS